ncbi:CocE/NonD family hydrolase [Agromyces agglutinans]|uniref:CocE/NonD family hydrolase n=1 Tax=Agromyces agglutinans TaxID=2662258 RepID=UPI0015620200|nr:CocE/NonD family hydrolase [Agromyces agglutinans]
MKSRILAYAGSVVIAAPLVLVGSGVANAAPEDNPPVSLVDNVTAPIYDYAGAIRETVWVTAPDLDGDGDEEQVAADIIRPRELDGTARVPIIMDASPYYLSSGRGNEAERKQYDADGNLVKFPLYYDNYFVPRGYAFVAVDMAGTARSTGCTDEGGRSDIESVKAVVEWLDGKGTAHDASGAVVEADWSNGKTGMIGKSYDGTLANGVAATGVENLETIVPISAISSWYDYNRWQGAVKSINYPSSLSRSVASNRTIATDCSARLDWMNANDGDETGAYTDFWAERDYRAGSYYDVSKVTASVFIMHGLQDTNVKTMNASKWWEDLGEQGVLRKMWLTRLGHVDPFDSERALWVETLHRWFDHELMDIDNGIDREPAVSVETAPNRWEHSPTWPIASARTQSLNLHSDGTMMLGRKDRSTASYINSTSLSEANAIRIGDNANRLQFLTGTTKHDLRISGTPTVDLDVTHTAPVGQVSVMLVDYGVMDRISASGDGAQTLDTETCWGPATATDDACYKEVGKRIASTELQVLARGWARLDGAGNHDVTVELAANDVVVPAGHQLGLVISGSRNGVLPVDTAATTYTVSLGDSKLNLPVSGPMAGFGPGHLTAKDTEKLSPGTLPDLDATVWPGR